MAKMPTSHITDHRTWAQYQAATPDSKLPTNAPWESWVMVQIGLLPPN